MALGRKPKHPLPEFEQFLRAQLVNRIETRECASVIGDMQAKQISFTDLPAIEKYKETCSVPKAQHLYKALRYWREFKGAASVAFYNPRNPVTERLVGEYDWSLGGMYWLLRKVANLSPEQLQMLTREHFGPGTYAGWEMTRKLYVPDPRKRRIISGDILEFKVDMKGTGFKAQLWSKYWTWTVRQMGTLVSNNGVTSVRIFAEKATSNPLVEEHLLRIKDVADAIELNYVHTHPSVNGVHDEGFTCKKVL